MELDEEREQQYDLLTAAIIGAAVGAGVTLLLRRGPSGRRPVGPLIRYAGRGAALAGAAGLGGAKWAGDRGLEGARWAGDRAMEGARWAGPRAKRGLRTAVERGEDLIDRIPEGVVGTIALKIGGVDLRDNAAACENDLRGRNV